jgi:DNA (cytosine-5)-methyltransferase 1
MHAEFRKGVGLSPKEREVLGLKKNAIVVLRGDRPSHTLTTLPDDYLHYCESRILTVRENARLQSFPDWFAFQGKYTTGAKLRTQEAPRYTQVGNAVPPLVAEVLGLAAAEIHAQLRAANLAALARIIRALHPHERARVRIPTWKPPEAAAA